jgi:hypothetical protein
MRRALLRTTVAGLALVAVVGLLHMPAFRPLLMSVAGCPFPTSGRTLSAREAEELRVHTFAPVRASTRAARMPALGFALGKDTRASVAAWARNRQVACAPDKHGASLRCEHVRARDLGEPSEAVGLLGLGFDARGVLVSVQFALEEPSRDRALALAREAERTLSQAGKAVPLRAGNLEGMLSQRHTLVAARDYRGEVMATRMGQGYVVAQSYQRFVP